MILVTLDRMAAGGMHDHLGGGFHRYSVDRFWHVPHFRENALRPGATRHRLSGRLPTQRPRADYADVARAILDYVGLDLRFQDSDSGSGFYCAEDADSLLAHGQPEHAEGAFYVWTRAEIEAALTPEEARCLLQTLSTCEAAGNAPGRQ